MVNQFEVMNLKAMELLEQYSNSDHEYVYQGKKNFKNINI